MTLRTTTYESSIGRCKLYVVLPKITFIYLNKSYTNISNHNHLQARWLTEGYISQQQIPYDDAVVISLTIANYDVKHILVDNGSSTNVLFYAVFSRMDLSKYRLCEVSTPLIGFTGDSVQVEGEITLPTTVGTSSRLSTVFLTYTVVKIPSTYNAILGRPGLNALWAVVSTYHILVWFPTKHGIGELRGDQQLAKHYFSIAFGQTKEYSPLECLNSQEEETQGAPVEELETHPLKEDDPTKTI